MHGDFIKSSGGAFLAHRLKRLSDRLVTDTAGVLKSLNLSVPLTAASALTLLASHHQLGVMEIAERLGVSHPFIVRLVAKLEILGLVQVTDDCEDLRRKWISLTDRGEHEAAQLQQLNKALRSVFADISAETEANLLEAINLFEAALAAKPLVERLDKQLTSRESQ